MQEHMLPFYKINYQCQVLDAFRIDAQHRFKLK